MLVKAIRNATTSPDGKFILFNALGKIWKKDLPNGKPQQLIVTQARQRGTLGEPAYEAEAAFSPDGKSIVYVTWQDEEMGTLKTYNLLTKSSKTLTTKKGIYRTPSYSPDGKLVVFRKDGGNGHQGFVHCKEPGLYYVPADGSAAPKFISPQGGFPMFNTKGDRIFYQTGGYVMGSLTKSFQSVDLNGKDKIEHFDGKYTHRYVISPDNQWVAWSELFKVYIAPFPKTGKKVGITAKTKSRSCSASCQRCRYQYSLVTR